MHEEVNKTNRFWIEYTEQEIYSIIQTNVFCVDKTCFPRSSRIYSIHVIYKPQLVGECILQLYDLHLRSEEVCH